MGFRKIPSFVAFGAVLSACGSQGSSTPSGPASTPTAIISRSADTHGPCFFDATLNQAGWIFLIVANQPITCAHTLPADFSNQCAEGPLAWEVCVALPPSALVVGSVDFKMGMNNAEEMDVGACSTPAECCAGQYLGNRGGLSISSVNASSMTFTLATQRMLAGDSSVSPDGTYTATRCP